MGRDIYMLDCHFACASIITLEVKQNQFQFIHLLSNVGSGSSRFYCSSHEAIDECEAQVQTGGSREKWGVGKPKW